MAALLRRGARRVGGSVVQRTRAAYTTPAVGEEQRLLTTEHVRPGPPKDPYLMEKTSMPKTYQNRELLKCLSVQVKPRPRDPKWCKMWHPKDSDYYALDTAILISTCFLGYKFWSWLARQSPDQEEARPMKEASCLAEKQT